MKGKFTQGPWQVKHSESKPAFNVIGTVVGGKYKIARCPYVVTERYPDTDKREKEEGEANARLIAAAPELLEALKSIVESTSDVFDCKFWYEHPASCINELRRAKSEKWRQLLILIAKATGEKEAVS